MVSNHICQTGPFTADCYPGETYLAEGTQSRPIPSAGYANDEDEV